MSPVRQARRNPRYPVHKIASYEYGAKRFLTFTHDLGLGGMKIRTHQFLPEDICLRFKLVLGLNLIWPKGRIVYSALLPDRQTVSGVHFLELTSWDHAALGDYLASLEAWPKSQSALSKADKASAWVDFSRPSGKG